MQKKRLFYTLDAIRGLLAILVMSRHLDAFIAPVTFQETYLAVDVFFLLSGIVICQAYEDKLRSGADMTPTSFFLVRLIRIWPLYILGSLIGLVDFIMQGGNLVAFGKGIFYLGLSVFFLPNPNLFGPDMYPLDGPAWSLFLELIANAFYGFFLLYLTNKRMIGIVLVSALGLLAMAAISPRHSIDVGWTLKSLPFGFLRVSFSFFAGVMLYRYFSRRPVRVIDGLAGNLAGTAIALVIAGMLMFATPGPAIQPYFDVFVVVLVFPALVYLSLYCNLSNGVASVARFLGVTSFAVYALHAPLGLFVELVDARLGLHYVEAFAPWGGIVMAAFVIGIAFVLDKVYDQPVRRAAVQWLKLRRGPTVESLDHSSLSGHAGSPATDKKRAAA